MISRQRLNEKRCNQQLTTPDTSEEDMSEEDMSEEDMSEEDMSEHFDEIGEKSLPSTSDPCNPLKRQTLIWVNEIQKERK